MDLKVDHASYFAESMKSQTSDVRVELGSFPSPTSRAAPQFSESTSRRGPWTTLLHAVTQLWHLSGLKGGFFVVAVYAVARRARGFLQGAGSDLLETYMCCCSIARARTLSLLNVLLKAYLPVSKAFQGAGEASSSISEPQAL